LEAQFNPALATHLFVNKKKTSDRGHLFSKRPKTNRVNWRIKESGGPLGDRKTWAPLIRGKKGGEGVSLILLISGKWLRD